MKAINIMKISFISKSANEAFARTAVASFFAQLDPPLAQINEIKTAISEAVTNSVVHGYKDNIGKIYISAKYYDNKKIIITVKDKGQGIKDVKKAMEPLYTTNTDGMRSGMGFTIMESFMDKIRVYSKVDKGTTVTMTKMLDIKK